MSLLSTREAAERCGVSAKTIGRWVDAGVLAAVFTTGGHRRVRSEDVDRFLADRRSLQARAETGAMLRVAILSADAACRGIVAAAARGHVGGGLAMRSADDAFAAGLLVSDFWPHLVLVDGALPGVDLGRLCRRLREAPPTQSATVAVLTDPGAPAALTSSGAHHVLTRPLTQDAIRPVILDADRRRDKPR